MKERLKYIFIFIGLILMELLYSYIVVRIIKILGLDIASLNEPIKSILLILIEISLILIVYFIFKKELESEFKDFKNNFGSLIGFTIALWAIGITLMIVTNMIIMFIYPSRALNETNVQTALMETPIYSTFAACIIAPFIEEIIFRKCLHKIFRNKICFIIMSGIIFGLIHNLDGLGTMQMLYIIPYGLFGSIFAYMYVKKKNIFVPITAHFIHNSLLILISLINSGVL